MANLTNYSELTKEQQKQYVDERLAFAKYSLHNNVIDGKEYNFIMHKLLDLWFCTFDREEPITVTYFETCPCCGSIIRKVCKTFNQYEYIKIVLGF